MRVEVWCNVHNSNAPSGLPEIYNICSKRLDIVGKILPAKLRRESCQPLISHILTGASPYVNRLKDILCWCLASFSFFSATGPHVSRTDLPPPPHPAAQQSQEKWLYWQLRPESEAAPRRRPSTSPPALRAPRNRRIPASTCVGQPLPTAAPPAADSMPHLTQAEDLQCNNIRDLVSLTSAE